MSRLAAFGRFWWDFVIGDDWLVAVLVVAGIGATAALATTSVAAWWLLPLVVLGVLWLSLRRAIPLGLKGSTLAPQSPRPPVRGAGQASGRRSARGPGRQRGSR
jgi:hypothetical protein